MTYSYEASLEILDNGNYAYSSGGRISVFSKDGKMICEISDKDRILKGGIIQENNKNYVVSSNGNYSDSTSILLKEVDIGNGKLKDGVDVSVLSSYGTIVATKDGLFANSYSGCFKYDIQKASVEQIFSWNDTDVDRALMKDITVTPKSENEILAIGHKSYESNKPFLIHLTRAETNPHAGKRLIVIGGENLSQCTDLLSFASSYSYNEKNSARIVLVDYTEGLNEDEGYSDIERSIYLDTLSGSGPDILVNMFDSVAFRTDAIMEDMNQYIDGKNGIKRKKYFDNIFRACETNGCLYHIPVRFGLEGLTVNTDIVPGSVGWTYSEFFEASGKVPEEVSFVQGVLYNELLELMLGTSLPQFVDYKNGTVDFLNEDMKHILETVKKYGVTKIPDDEAEVHMKKVVPDEGSLEGDFDLCQEKFKEGMLAIKVSWLNNVYDVAVSRDYCAGTAAFVGFPAREKTAMAVSPSLTLGIVSSSKCKGLAWDFIHAFMEGEGQEYQLQFSSSVRKEAFEKEAKIMMDNRNEFYETEAKDGPQIARMMVTPVIDEDFSTFKELAENVTISTGGDPAIFNIICEEAAGYFAGDRSVEEVMKNIQNRASIVVKEL